MKRNTYLALLTVSIVLVSCTPDGDTTTTTDPTNVTADKDGMGASVGDTGVFATVEFNVNAEESTTTFTAGDGWSVDFDKFLITIGNFYAVSESGTDEALGDTRTVIVDLTTLFGAEFTISLFERVTSGRFSSVGFDMPDANSRSTKASSTKDSDRQLMVTNGYSIYIEGVMTRAGGLSCTPGEPMDCTPAEQIIFRWGFRAGTVYDGCSDFEVTAGEVTSVDLLMGGETWFAPGFSKAGYDPAKTHAQWIADADLDRDGETTLEELQGIKAGLLFTPELSYDFEGAPIPIATAYDFVEAQARDLGRRSYGYCTTSRPL